ncbi:hypothetical protein QFZ99_005759 [Paraburkholderia atlantica]|uniref:hypothetical protein n=1 Tax=Paraburkholderia atlantica TaxID=2654982 RepID=UPI003D1C0B23
MLVGLKIQAELEHRLFTATRQLSGNRLGLAAPLKRALLKSLGDSRHSAMNVDSLCPISPFRTCQPDSERSFPPTIMPRRESKDNRDSKHPKKVSII